MSDSIELILPRSPQDWQEISFHVTRRYSRKVPTETGCVVMEETATLPPGLGPIAGFWRRFFAFVIDALLLGALGTALGAADYDGLVALGDWGRALGFAIALVYFGLTDGRPCNGQSFGKWLLGIRVVSADGSPLSAGASTLRATIFCVPYFLNGASVGAVNSWLGVLSSVVVFGVGLSIVYLLVFNRRTRQSLHDLAANAYVVMSKGAGAAEHPQAIWQVHFGIVGFIVVGALALPYVAHRLAMSDTFAGLLAAQQALEQEPDVRHAAVNVSVNRFSSSEQGATTTHAFNSRIFLLRRITDFDAVANRSAQTILDRDPAAGSADVINVQVIYGYDIGIAAAWRNQNFSYSPEIWRRRIEAQRSNF